MSTFDNTERRYAFFYGKIEVLREKKKAGKQKFKMLKVKKRYI